MAERSIHRERLCAVAPLRVGGTTLLPVSRVELRLHGGGAPLLWCLATQEPVALVVHDASGTRACGIDGLPLPLTPLLESVEGLAQALHEARAPATGGARG